MLLLCPYACPAVTTSEPTDRFSWNLVWTSCHWRLLHHYAF